MHPEIEKLIDLGIVDGQITEKERKVIQKKAAELGVDADEVEMTLDGRLYQLEASKPEEKEKVGKIKTCPACGAPAKAMEVACVCGHEYTNIDLSISLNALMKKIALIDINDYTFGVDYYSKIATIIRSTSIPNSAEEIYTFGTKALTEIKSNTDRWGEDSLAWKSKLEECLLKLKLIELNNPAYSNLRIELEKGLDTKVKQIKKKSNEAWLIILLFGVIVFIAVGFLISTALKFHKIK